jgi:hypothetical protein
MIRITSRLVCLVAMGCGAATPALASSTAASSTSDSIAVSVGSVSTSFGKSSDSSTRKNDVAEGDYKIVEVAAVEERPGVLRMTLQAVAGQDDFVLYLPQKAVDNGRVGIGDIVTAQHREYGVEFEKTQTRRAFFLVLSDVWYRELQTNPVAL